MSTPKSTIPVLVINWNGLEDTLECMDALLDQTYSAIHIYLVDNGSEHGDAETLASRYATMAKVTVACLPENFGFTLASNKLLKRILEEHPNAEYIAMCNNDVVADSTWMENLYAGARKYNAGILASKMLYYYDPSKMDNAGHMMLNTGEIVPIGHMESSEIYKHEFENLGACAGAALYSVSMLRSIGFFDSFFATGYEDAELGVRAAVCGFRSYYIPSAQVRHKISRSLQKVKDQNYVVRIQRAIFYSYFKLMPTAYLILHLPILALRYCIIFLIDILFLRWSALRFHIRSIHEFIRYDLGITLKSRKEFRKGRRLLGTVSVMKRVKFFLLYDIRRFFRYVILRQKSTFHLP